MPCTVQGAVTALNLPHNNVSGAWPQGVATASTAAIAHTLYPWSCGEIVGLRQGPLCQHQHMLPSSPLQLTGSLDGSHYMINTFQQLMNMSVVDILSLLSCNLRSLALQVSSRNGWSMFDCGVANEQQLLLLMGRVAAMTEPRAVWQQESPASISQLSLHFFDLYYLHLPHVTEQSAVRGAARCTDYAVAAADAEPGLQQAQRQVRVRAPGAGPSASANAKPRLLLINQPVPVLQPSFRRTTSCFPSIPLRSCLQPAPVAGRDDSVQRAGAHRQPADGWVQTHMAAH